MARRFAGTDDPHPLLVVGIRVDVNDHQEGNRTNYPDRMPSLVAVFDAIRDDDMQGVIQTNSASSKATGCLIRFAPVFSGFHTKRIHGL